MKLKIIHYHYDITHIDEEIAWEALCKKLDDGRHQHCSHSFGNQPFTDNYEEIINVDTNYIFSDQFNEEGGKNRRLFDWYLQYRLKGKSIKQGHYVEDLSELNALRAITFTCGYCGKPGKGVFCDKCLGSEYLEKSDLFLLRLLPKNQFMPGRPQLTPEETVTMELLWEKAQGLGKLSREEAEGTKARRCVANLVPEAEAEAKEIITKAKFKTRAHTWLLDHKFKDLSNTIIYKDQILTFGWRDSIKDKQGLEKLLADAPFEWSIK